MKSAFVRLCVTLSIILYADLVNSEIMAFPGDCTKYQLCDVSGCFVFDCAPGTEFNPLVSVCDYPLSDRGSCSAMMAAAASGMVGVVVPGANGQQVGGAGSCQKCAGGGAGANRRPQGGGVSGNAGPQGGHPFGAGNQGPRGAHASGGGFQRPQAGGGGAPFGGANQRPQAGNPFLAGGRPMPTGSQAGGSPAASGHAFGRPGDGAGGSPYPSATQHQQTVMLPSGQGANCRACQNGGGAAHQPSGGMGMGRADPFPGHGGHMGAAGGAPQRPAPYPSGGAAHQPSGGTGMGRADPFPGHGGHMGAAGGAPQRPAPYPSAHQAAGGAGADYDDPDDNGGQYDDSDAAAGPPLKKYTPPPGIGDNANTIC